jgi:chromate transport protein ChrA
VGARARDNGGFPPAAPAMVAIADYPSFVIAVIVFLMIPGPGNLALVTSTGKGGLSGGLAATLGVIVGDQVLMWLAVAGVAALLAARPAAFHAVQWLGAGYLAWLGLRMLVAKPGDRPVLTIRAGQYFRQAFAITLLNPKAIVFYMAFFPLFVDPARPAGNRDVRGDGSDDRRADARLRCDRHGADAPARVAAARRSAHRPRLRACRRRLHDRLRHQARAVALRRRRFAVQAASASRPPTRSATTRSRSIARPSSRASGGAHSAPMRSNVNQPKPSISGRDRPERRSTNKLVHSKPRGSRRSERHAKRCRSLLAV